MILQVTAAHAGVPGQPPAALVDELTGQLEIAGVSCLAVELGQRGLDDGSWRRGRAWPRGPPGRPGGRCASFPRPRAGAGQAGGSTSGSAAATRARGRWPGGHGKVAWASRRTGRRGRLRYGEGNPRDPDGLGVRWVGRDFLV